MTNWLPALLAWLGAGAAWLLGARYLARTRAAIAGAPASVRERATEDAARRGGA